MNRCYGYIRVSKDPKREKLSPEIQRQLIERYARKERLQLVEIYGDVDVPSAKINLTGTWQKLYDSLEEGDLILTNDVTRLGRDLYETLTRARAVDKLGVEVISLEGTIDRERAAGKFMFHVLLATAQFINDQLSEKAIINRDLWERVQARERATTRSAAAGRYLLSGLIVCGECGCPMVHWSGQARGKRRRILQCKEARSFPGEGKTLVSIEAHLAEGWVVSSLFSRVNAKNVERQKARVLKQRPKRESRAENLRRQLEKVEASLERLVSDYYDADEPLLSPDQFRKKNVELVQRRAAIAAELQLLEDEAQLDNVVYLERARRDLRESWEGMTLKEQREALRLYIEKIIVHPRTPGKKIDPARVEIVWK